MGNRDKTNRRRAVFLDRDGVINRSPGTDRFVLRWEEFRFADGVEDALARLKTAGFVLVVATNQSCVGRGMLGEPELREIHRRMRAHLASRGAPLDGIYHCPHHPEAGCLCRKPRPTLLLRAAKRWLLDLPRSFMVGDSPRDIAMGRAAGCRTILCRPGKSGDVSLAASETPHMTCRSLPEAANLILSAGPFSEADG